MAYQTTNSITPEYVKQGSLGGVNILNGVYVGTVVANDDSIYTGRIKVHFPEFEPISSSQPFASHLRLSEFSPKEASGDPY